MLSLLSERTLTIHAAGRGGTQRERGSRGEGPGQTWCTGSRLVKIRKRYATLAVVSSCPTCGTIWHGVNALAVGARHARAHGHQVHASWTTGATYDPAPRSFGKGVS